MQGCLKMKWPLQQEFRKGELAKSSMKVEIAHSEQERNWSIYSIPSFFLRHPKKRGYELKVTPEPIFVSLDAGRLQSQLGALRSLLEYVPKRRVHKILRKLYCLVFGLSLCQIPGDKNRLTSIANHFAFEVRIVGLDELIASAFRAAKRNLNVLWGHDCPFLDWMFVWELSFSQGSGRSPNY